MPRLGWIEELRMELQRAGFVLLSGGDEGVEDAFEGSGRTGPAAGKGFAMNR